MATPPQLLNDDGSASMATMFMLSHHAFRRDLAYFVRALTAETPRPTEALQGEWQSFHHHLHGHHQVEDNGMFPGMRGQHPDLAACIDGLAADHRKIDPLLEKGDAAFAQLPSTAAALSVVRELQALLEPHLATEEAELIPHIRAAKAFPPPGTEAEAEMYAEGFAWSAHGVAPDILEKVFALLPEILTSRLPAARAAFSARCERVWGTTQAGAARTPIPEL
jgi:hypothetical protein